MKYILAIDQGTLSCRATLFNKSGQLVAVNTKKFGQFYPQPDWVEQDAVEIYNTVVQVMKDVVKEAGIDPTEIISIGIANQRETVVLWDKHSGEPIYHAIVWQDKRTDQLCSILRGKRDLNRYVKENTGLLIDSYFSAPKLKWLLDNVKDARRKAEAGDLLFGTIDTWLVWKMTGGWVHATDFSNASRTMLFNIKSLDWDIKILEDLEIPGTILPEVRPTCGSYDVMDEKILGVEIPITAVIADQQAALFGQACIREGMVKSSYGIGSFILRHTGNKMVESKHGLLSTIAWCINDKVEYAIEGGIFIAGGALDWLGRDMKLIDQSEDSDFYANKVNDSNGLYFVPAFSGLGAPYWDANATGAIFGLRQNTKKAHLIRATLEAIAYRTKDILDAMDADAQANAKVLRVDGNLSRNAFLMQFQADILGYEVLRPESVESTSRGAAFLAGIGAGIWKKEDVERLWKMKSTFSPLLDKDKRDALYRGWKKAVNRCLQWS